MSLTYGLTMHREQPWTLQRIGKAAKITIAGFAIEFHHRRKRCKPQKVEFKTKHRGDFSSSRESPPEKAFFLFSMAY